MLSLRSERVPCGPIHNIAEAFRFGDEIGLDPVVSLPAGARLPLRSVANPVRLSVTPVEYHTPPPPRLGEHTEQVFSWLTTAVDGGERRATRVGDGRGST